MTDRSWKQAERRVASFFGTQRTSLSGGNSKITRSDTMHPRLFIEAKQRGRQPILEQWYACKRDATKAGKIPAVALSVYSREDHWILCHCDDIIAVADDLAAAGGHKDNVLFLKFKKTVIACVSLWIETDALAQDEGKVPVVALQEKRKPGFWIVAHVGDLEAIKRELRGRVNDQHNEVQNDQNA